MSSNVDKQLGYLERADQEHTKDIDGLYDLVANHMAKEEATIKGINQKLLFLGALMLVTLGKDISWAELVARLIAP